MNAEHLPPHNGTETSKAAAESMVHHVTGLQTSILEAVRKAPGGKTCDEIEFELGLKHQNASARIYELRHMGLLLDSGTTRWTRSSRRAKVWIVRGNPKLLQKPAAKRDTVGLSVAEKDAALQDMRNLYALAQKNNLPVSDAFTKLGSWLKDQMK